MKRQGENQTEHDFLSQEFLMDENTSSVEVRDIEQSHSNKETLENNECASNENAHQDKNRLPQNRYDKGETSTVLW